MARRRRDLEAETQEGDADVDIRRQLHKLTRAVFWTYKTDAATAGGSSNVDPSPYSLRRAAIQDEFAAERRRLAAAGVPLAEQLALLTDWWETAIAAAVAIRRAPGANPQ